MSALTLLALTDALGEAYLARERARNEAKLQVLEREEEERTLALLPVEKHEAYLAERRRQRERREDIHRQERQHRERLAVESRKVDALRSVADAQQDRAWNDLFFGEYR